MLKQQIEMEERAVDDNKLIQLIFNQRPVPDQAFDTRIDSRARQLVREEQVMKRRFLCSPSPWPCSCPWPCLGRWQNSLASTSLNGSAGQSAPEGTGSQSCPAGSLPVSTTEQKLGTAAAAITSAYYDGQSLILGYAVENGNALETFDPHPNNWPDGKGYKSPRDGD